MTELRGKHFRRYLMSDGSVQAVVSQRAMHYQDNSGDWQEIDTAVEAGAEKVSFRNDTNSLVSEFGSTTGELGAVEYSGHRVAIGRAGAVEPVTPRGDGSRVTYDNVFGSGDVRYTVLPDALKEDIVLPSVPEQETFEFSLAVGELKARRLDDGSVGLFATGEADPVFVLPKPYMVDSSDGATAEDGWSYEVKQSFTQSDGELTVTISPDRRWLTAKERVYPVVIDPTITIAPAPDAAKDTMIRQASPSTSYGSWASAYVGNSGSNASRALYSFDINGLVPSGTTLTSAKLRLHMSKPFVQPSAPVTMSAHRVTAPWAEGTATWSTLSTAFEATGSPTITMPTTQRDVWHEYDVKTIVQKWVAGTAANYGFAVKATDEVNGTGGPAYESSEALYGTAVNRPQLVLQYAEPSVTLNVPSVVREGGPELSWSKYADPSAADEDDLVEYVVYRQCVSLPGGACTTPAGDQFNASTAEQIGVVPNTAPAAELKFTDTTAVPSTATAESVYNYWVVAKLAGDGTVAGQPLSPSSVQRVTLPRPGRVFRVLSGDVKDSTLSSVAQDSVLPEPDTQRWDMAGNDNYAGLGDTRAVIAFDTASLPADQNIVSARLETWESTSNGSGATFALHELTKDFLEPSVTWRKASSTINWTALGGDFVSTPVTTQTADSTPKMLRWPATSAPASAHEAMRALVAKWAASPLTDNHGVLIKAVDEVASQQTLMLASGESSDPAFRPRLVVEQLDRASEEVYYAPSIPERFVPDNEGAYTIVPITVTNTTTATWPMDWAISYRWCVVNTPCVAPDFFDDVTSEGDRLPTGLGRALEPGESYTVKAKIKTPINADTGSKRLNYDLHVELRKPDGHWLSEAAPNGLGIDPLIAEDRLIEAPTSGDLGLEKFLSFSGEETGAGSQLLANLHSGNVAWTYAPIQNPAVGPATFVRLTYNGQDTASSQNDVAPGWSIQTSSLTRLGSSLDVSATGQDQTVRLIDGDGTTHTWKKIDDGSTTRWSYNRPAGVPLELHKDITAGADPNRLWTFTRPDGTRFFFDGNGRQTAIADTNGNELHFNYNAAGKLSTLVDRPKGMEPRSSATLTLTYNAAGKVATITDISGRVLTFVYNGAGQLEKLTDGKPGELGDKIFGFTYTTTSASSNQRLATVVDPREMERLAAAGKTVSQAAVKTSVAYVASGTYAGWPTEWTDRRGQVTRVTPATIPEGSPRDLLTTVTDVTSKGDLATKYVTDGFGRTTTITDAKNQATELRWDGDHNVVRLEEANGAVSTWQFDDRTGYPTLVKDAEANKAATAGTVLAYKQLLQAPGAPWVLDTKTSPEGRKWVFGYDPLTGDLKTVTDPIGRATTYAYNANGLLLTSTGPAPISAQTKFAGYDYNGFPATITDPLLNATSFTYDERGNVKTVTDALGAQTTAEYDEFGRPKKVTTPGSGTGLRTVETGYDVSDNITHEVAPNGAVTEHSYGQADERLSTTLPANGSGLLRQVSYGYDDLGQPTRVTQPRGNLTLLDVDDFVTLYDYDSIGQLISETRPYQDGSTAKQLKTTFAYDNVGNLIKATNPRTFVQQTSYDLNHQPIAATDQAGFTTRARYDRDGLPVASVDAEGNTSFTEYDAAGQVVKVRVPHTTSGSDVVYRETSFEYDVNGNRTKVIRPSGAVDEVRYDKLGRVTERVGASDATYQASHTYFEYDAVGRMKRQSDPTFAADPTNTAIDWSKFSYFPSGDVKESQDPWNIRTGYDYNLLGQQTARTLTSAAGTATRGMSWTFNDDGSLASRSDSTPEDGLVERMVDNTETGNALASVGTNWESVPATDGDGAVGHNYRRHPAATSSTDVFRWELDIPVAGTYEIFASCPKGGATATAAPFTVEHANGSTAKSVPQASCEGGWVSLGSYTYDVGGDKSVILKPAAGGTVVADAVRAVKAAAGGKTTMTYTYGYDVNGQMVGLDRSQTATADDSIAVSYDTLNRASVVSQLWAGSQVDTSYTYDANSNVLSVFADHKSAPTGRKLADQYLDYVYDARDMVSRARAGASSAGPFKSATYTYTARGLRGSLTKHNKNVTTYRYYRDAALRSMTEKTSVDALVASHALTYTPDGDKLTDTSSVRHAETGALMDKTATYAYTPARLLAKVTKSSGAGSPETYGYDAAGNVVSQTVRAVTTTSWYDRNRLQNTKAVDSAGATLSHIDYSYDPFGRLTSTSKHSTAAAAGGLLSRYTYDGFDRMTRYATFDGTGSTTEQTVRGSTFDGMDRTMSETVRVGAGGPKTTWFRYLGLTDTIAAEEQKDAAGEIQISATYHYGAGGERLAMFKPLESATSGLREAYFSTNPHSDVEAVTKYSGDTTSTYRYTAYGSSDPLGTTGEDADTGDTAAADVPVHNPWRFNSKRWDAASKSYDMGFRDYSPGLNRFLTRDMYNGALADLALGSDPWNTNRYAFAGGNPVTGIELDGHIFDSEPTGGLMPHCVSYCGAYEERQAAIEAERPQGDLGDWLGGVADSFAEAAADSTPLVKALPGPHPAEIASNAFNDLVDADTGTGAYRRGQGAGDAVMLLGAFFTVGATSASSAPLAAEKFIQTARATRAAKSGDELQGQFSIIDWSGYPTVGGVPRPTGPFRLLEGEEYAAARSAANAANRQLHADAGGLLKGLQIHEVQPVKFGGSPVDPANKIALDPLEHARYTVWWNRMQRGLGG